MLSGPIRREIGVRAAEIAMTMDRDAIALVDQLRQAFGPDKPFQHRATLRIERVAQTLDERRAESP